MEAELEDDGEVSDKCLALSILGCPEDSSLGPAGCSNKRWLARNMKATLLTVSSLGQRTDSQCPKTTRNGISNPSNDLIRVVHLAVRGDAVTRCESARRKRHLDYALPRSRTPSSIGPFLESFPHRFIFESIKGPAQGASEMAVASWP